MSTNDWLLLAEGDGRGEKMSVARDREDVLLVGWEYSVKALGLDVVLVKTDKSRMRARAGALRWTHPLKGGGKGRSVARGKRTSCRSVGVWQ